ncbi:MAG: hypothetical protein E7617_06470 [Ruminococcaceae bacterium]|nr:hypothetical protein [Oscillospiraceae bacterium]
MKSTIKRSLSHSIVALVLCFSMLLGSTYAWFTDIASSKDNVITTGDLDIGMYWSENNVDWHETEGIAAKPIFSNNKWEPGYTEVRYVKITNEGSLAFKYKMLLSPNGTVGKLAKVIDVSYDVVTGNSNFVAPTADNRRGSLTKVGNLKELIAGNGTVAGGVLLPENETKEGFYSEEIVICIALHMDEEAGNEYENSSIGTTFDINLYATQYTYETDSFGDMFDSDSKFADEIDFKTSASVAQVETLYGELANDFTIRHSNSVYAVLPAGVKLADGATTIEFSGKTVDNNSNITVGAGESATNYDIHIEGIASDNTQPIIVHLGAILAKGMSDTTLKLYHEGTLMTRVNSVSDFSINNQYTYDSATGEVVIYVDNFSIFSAVNTTADGWDGNSDTTWYNENDTEFTLTTAEQFAGFRDLVDAGNTFKGKTVKLGIDIDLADKLFDPIGFGYYNEETNTRVFMGIFDGQNHTVYNLYQNGWELGYSYSTAGGGLFASIKDAAIKNLAVSGAEIVMECIDMGTVVGYAQGTCNFENILVTDSKLANYQRYTGGVVGEVSGGAYGTDVSKDYSHTFTNVVVDSSVKISSLWGDFDNACGGVIGGKWGDATVKMVNVIVAAEIDAFSDVTAAYQWYAYRRCGMLIGHTEQNSPKSAINAAAEFLTCDNVKVYYGDWVNYTYYEFEDQENATGRNYPWVRAEAGEHNAAFSNPRYGVPTYDGVKVSDLTEEDLKAKATDYTPIVFDQLYGGGQGVYGCATHDGVEIMKDATLSNSKTIYIYNNDPETYKNLFLDYWYRNGDNTWSTVVDSIPMDNIPVSQNVYKVTFLGFVDGFRVTMGEDEDSNVVCNLTLENLEDGAVIDITGNTHEHAFDNEGECVCGAYKAQVWEQVTNASNLAVGDKVIIVAKDYNYAMSTKQNSNNRGQASVTKDGNQIAFGDDIQIITLESGTVDGTFALYADSGYLCAASSSSNYLRTQATNDANGSWKITIAADGTATIVAQGTYTRNTMQYNQGSSLFACYASATQKALVIYKLTAGSDIVDTHNCLDYVINASCEDDGICSKCGKIVENTASGHNYSSVVTEPTCTMDGYTTYICSICDDEYEDEHVDALGHNFIGNTCDRCSQKKSSFEAVDIDNINPTDIIVIVWTTKDGNSYTLTNDKGTSSAPAAEKIDLGGEFSVGDNHKWNIVNDNGNLTIYPNGTTETWLYCTSTNNGVRVGTNANNIFTIDADSGYLKNTATSRYLGVYTTNPDVRCYTSTTTNIDGQTLAFYKLNDGTSGGETPDPETPCEHTNTTTTTVDETCTEAGSITVTCDDCGKTVSTEVIGALGHTTENGTCERCGEEIGGSSEPETNNVSILGTTGTLAADKSSISWTSENITVTNTKGSTAIRNSDADHYRIYSGSGLTISADSGNITEIVITCTSSSYADVCVTSFENAGYEVTVSGSVVTITLSEPAESITATASAQFRISNVEVTYTA